MDFKDQLSNFKPRQSVLETAIIQTNDSEKIKKFKHILESQKQAAQFASDRKKTEADYERIEN